MSADVLKDLAPHRQAACRHELRQWRAGSARHHRSGPKGVAPDLARELGKRLNVPVTFVGFDGAGAVFDALKVPSDDPKAWDVAFLAIEPVRAAEIAFTAPYVLIEGTYMVLKDSPLKTIGDVDRPGHRISVGPKSAYDLFLTRTAETRRAHSRRCRWRRSDGAAFLTTQSRCRCRRRVSRWKPTPRPIRILRVMSDRFMEIRQAMGTHQGRDAGAAYIKAFVEEMKALGFVADALERSNQKATVAPAEK